MKIVKSLHRANWKQIYSRAQSGILATHSFGHTIFIDRWRIHSHTSRQKLLNIV